jgi:selenocysteine lyase/cysteine desulfurase
VGVEPVPLAEHLWKQHHILATPIVHPEFRGLRVTPSVYTTLDEIDHFSEVMEGIAEKGLMA